MSKIFPNETASPIRRVSIERGPNGNVYYDPDSPTFKRASRDPDLRPLRGIAMFVGSLALLALLGALLWWFRREIVVLGIALCLLGLMQAPLWAFCGLLAIVAVSSRFALME